MRARPRQGEGTAGIRREISSATKRVVGGRAVGKCSTISNDQLLFVLARTMSLIMQTVLTLLLARRPRRQQIPFFKYARLREQ